MPFTTVRIRVTGTYTEPPGSYGQPIGSVTTVVSDTKSFQFDFWVQAGTLAQQQAWATAMANEKTKDMRQLGQVFSTYFIALIGVNRPYAPLTP